MHELGIITAKGAGKVSNLTTIIREPEDERVPPVARFALGELANQREMIGTELGKLEKAIAAMVKQDPDMKRLTAIPGIDPITAASIRAFVPDISGFKSARHFAAWLGLTPKPHSSDAKERLEGISKMGNRALRSLLVLGALSSLRLAKNPERAPKWIAGLLARRPAKVVAVAMAKKTARIAYALLTKGEDYRKSPVSAA